MSLEWTESAAVDVWFVLNAMSDICGKRMDCAAERSVTLVAVLLDHAVPVATRKMMRREDTVYYPAISMIRLVFSEATRT